MKLKLCSMKQIKCEMKRQGLSMETDVEQFAMALKTWRLRKGYTQKQVGDRWQMSRYTIMKAEAGKQLAWEMVYRMFAKLSYELEIEVKGA